MIIGTCTVTLRAPWVSSLKEKRMIVKSLLDKTGRKFNISIAEVEKQDVHQEIVIGFACVTNEVRHANSIISHVLDYMEKNTDADWIHSEIEIL